MACTERDSRGRTRDDSRDDTRGAEVAGTQLSFALHDLNDTSPRSTEQEVELRCRLAVARAAGRAGHLAEAEVAAQGALGMSQAVELQAERAEAHNILGGVAFERGDLETASYHYHESLRLARDVDHSDAIVRAGNNLASICHLRGEVDGARKMYLDVLETHRERRNRRGQAETLCNLALTYRESRDIPTAMHLSAAAYDHALAIGDPSLLAMVVSGQAEGALDIGSTDRAMTLISCADEFARTAGDPLRQAEVDRVRARCLARRGEIEKALALVADAGVRAVELSARLLQAECAATEGEILMTCGRSPEAAARFVEASRLFLEAGVRKESTHRLSIPKAIRSTWKTPVRVDDEPTAQR